VVGDLHSDNVDAGIQRQHGEDAAGAHDVDVDPDDRQARAVRRNVSVHNGDCLPVTELVERLEQRATEKRVDSFEH
jgi:hypothetical protein